MPWLSLWLCGAVRRTAGSPGPPTAAEQVVRAYFERFGEGDPAGVASLFHPEASFLPNGGATVSGRDAIRVYFEDVFGRATVRFDRVTVDRVVELGGAAVVEARTDETITVHDPARTVIDEFRELFVLRREGDGTWTIDSYVGNALTR